MFQAIYLRKKYNMALQRSSELNERMETLETNLVDNGLPLTDWKATLADFRAKVVDPSFPKKELQNPYEPERSKGMIARPLRMFRKSYAETSYNRSPNTKRSTSGTESGRCFE